MRRVSCFGPDSVDPPGPESGNPSAPGGFGKGCSTGDAETGDDVGIPGEARQGFVAGSAGIDGMIFGGTRRTGAQGTRDGRRILPVSGWAVLAEGGALSGRGGSAIRTGSLFGSVMGGPSVRDSDTNNGALSFLIWNGSDLLVGAAHYAVRNRGAHATRTPQRGVPTVTPAGRNRGCR